MKTFVDWAKENGIDVPEHSISGKWFADHGIPMVVACTSCGTTMCAVSAMIDDDGHTYCSSCAK